MENVVGTGRALNGRHKGRDRGGEGLAELRQGHSQELQVELRDQRWVE